MADERELKRGNETSQQIILRDILPKPLKKFPSKPFLNKLYSLTAFIIINFYYRNNNYYRNMIKIEFFILIAICFYLQFFFLL